MLVLSRHKGQRIVINDNITLIVVEIRGDRVRLGIEAPREVKIDRAEVRDKEGGGNSVAPLPQR